MRIICDFESLVGQPISILEFFYTFFNHGLIKAIFSPEKLPLVPCDSEAVSALVTNFPNQMVVINTSEKYKKYGESLAEFLTDNTLTFTSITDLNMINEDIDVYLSSSLMSMYKRSSVYEKIFIGDMFRSTIFYMLFPGQRYVRNKFLCGAITILLSSLSVIPFVFLSSIYNVFSSVIYQELVDHFVISILFCMVFKILRELMQVMNEWEFYVNGLHPRSSWPFINCSSSMTVGVFYLMFGSLCCALLCFYFPFSSLLSMITGIMYFASYNCKFVVRGLFGLISGGIVWLISSYVL